jgi:hypothetical protein
MKLLYLILPLIIALSGCSSIIPGHNVPIWKYKLFKRPPDNQDYPPLYITGWQHGCESGAEASANYLYRLKYKFKQDWSLLGNTYYVRGWEDSYNYCRKYVLRQNLGPLGKNNE